MVHRRRHLPLRFVFQSGFRRIKSRYINGRASREFLIDHFYQQQFSDDEGEEEELELVPLPEEPDAGEDEMDQDETPANLNQPDAVALETPQISNPPSAPDSVTPPEPALVGDPTALSNVEPLPPLSSVPIEMDLELQPPSNLGPLDLEDLTVVQDNAPNGDGVHLELTGLGPDGTLPGDMTQIHEDDIVLGGPMMDHTGDPFAESKMAE